MVETNHRNSKLFQATKLYFDLHCCYHSRCLLKATYKVESGCNCYTETILIF